MDPTDTPAPPRQEPPLNQDFEEDSTDSSEGEDEEAEKENKPVRKKAKREPDVVLNEEDQNIKITLTLPQHVMDAMVQKVSVLATREIVRAIWNTGPKRKSD